MLLYVQLLSLHSLMANMLDGGVDHILYYVQYFNVILASSFIAIITIINIISILPMPSEYECVHACIYILGHH